MTNEAGMGKIRKRGELQLDLNLPLSQCYRVVHLVVDNLLLTFK